MTFNDTEKIIIAGYIAEDNLIHTNAVSAPVKVKNTIYSVYIKRLIDIVVSGFALLVTMPINLIIAIVTFFDVGCPILFHQNRIGKDGKEFEIVKFRNMTNETDAEGNLLLPKDRVTKWGRFVRRTSLDELLNFWSIFKGDMSLIGPRPLICNYQDRYSERHMMRHAVRPGLECPCLSDVSFSGCRWQERFENDIWYVENISFLTDVKMVLKLVQLVFDRKESKLRGGAQRGGFLGYDENGIAIDSSDIPQKYIERLYNEYGNAIKKKSLEEIATDKNMTNIEVSKIGVRSA